ncbi:hypothetical protein OG453_07255 [Streptomyces sp. NBC_01381]|uniref:hypothetical protein n=1 Tax=Streptomyces sp. NBC_01381 TaxID=2903845 RepID=UPI002250727A|nr:hypothetical protein [Streptomyces sp. NBC_01381]MCX4666465.1 hypothetical protein [Streptomyces sp. NBC_01381]
MGIGWSTLVVAVCAVVAFVLFGIARGARQQHRESTRQAFMQLQSVQKAATSLAELTSRPAVAFAPPFADGRPSPFG